MHRIKYKFNGRDSFNIAMKQTNNDKKPADLVKTTDDITLHTTKGTEAAHTLPGGNKNSHQKQKRAILLTFAAMLAIVVIWYAGVPAAQSLYNYIEQKINEKKVTSDYLDRIKSLRFYEANYEENVYDDKEYMNLNRYIAYTEGMDTFYITDDDYSRYDAPIAFFARYFKTVIEGKYEEYDSYFTENYFKDHKNKETFAPQKIYDIEIKYISKLASAEKDETTYIYKVGFKIFKNNGTFRNDIESDASRPLFYTVIEYKDGTVLIDKISVSLDK